MARQGFEAALTAGQVAGPALTNTVTPTSIVPVASRYTLPANFFDVPGKTVKITAIGQLSNLVTTPGTLTLDVRLGAIVVFNGGAMQLSSTAHTTLPIWIEILLTCRAVGNATANLIGQGRMTSQALSLTAVADSTTTPATLLAPNTTPAVGNGFDSTSSQVVDMFGTFSIANAANAITIQQFLVEDIN
jgi:hypothetical protein